MQTSSQTNVIALIGALELDRPRIGIDDAVLEESAANIYAGPSQGGLSCAPAPGFTKPPICSINFIDDAALENAAGGVYAGPSYPPQACQPSGVLPCNTSMSRRCYRNGDAALENAGAKLYAGPTSTSSPCTHMRQSNGACVL